MDDETYWKERKEEENREKQKRRDDDAFLGYRRQQEDEAKYKKEGGCYIATAIYNDYNHPKVIMLRHYRDEVLSKSFIGQQLIKFYYKFSPALIKTSLFKTLLHYPIKLILDVLIRLLSSLGRS